jgi:tetratricopeptide (TPR) repeat protein
MKKVTLAFFMLLIVGSISAQDFKKVNTAFLLNRVEDARTELEKVLADPKSQNNADAHLWKARVYGRLFSDSVLRIKYPESGNISRSALNSYLQLDPESKKLKEAGLEVVDNLYIGNFLIGQKYFTKQVWDSAFKYFTNSYDLRNQIVKNKWRNLNQPIDTFSLLFSAYSAQTANKRTEALKFFEEIVNMKIGGADNEFVYEQLIENYYKAKNIEQVTRYLPIAKELYPENKFFKGVEATYKNENTTLAEKLKMYDEALAKGKLSSEEYFDFGSMFANINKEDAKDFDSTAIASMKRKAANAFKRAYEMDTTNLLAAYNAGVVTYQEIGQLQDRYESYKGPSAAFKAKREEINKTIDPINTESILWLEKFYQKAKLKATRERVETVSLNRSVDILANLYEWKRDYNKGKNVKDVDLYDAKFQQYIKEHNLYK